MSETYEDFIKRTEEEARIRRNQHTSDMQSSEYIASSTIEVNSAPMMYAYEISSRNPELADNINHPKHYTEHPSGIECIQITEHMSFNLGNALKYIWRCDLKKDAIEDLKKARWYINREIQLRDKE